jgi:hypothetical protein
MSANRKALMFRQVVLSVVVLGSMPIPQAQDASLQKEVARLGASEKLMPRGKQALFMARGEGVQIYKAEEKDGKLEWVFQAPQATLFDYRTGEKVGSHSAGPTWTDSDGGKLTGKKVASDEAPNGDAVPWLLLEVKAENGGRFASVTNVQRLDTWGGHVPAAGPTRLGETREVRYEATYVFMGNR